MEQNEFREVEEKYPHVWQVLCKLLRDSDPIYKINGIGPAWQGHKKEKDDYTQLCKLILGERK